jgi:Calcium-activated chloride channel
MNNLSQPLLEINDSNASDAAITQKEEQRLRTAKSMMNQLEKQNIMLDYIKYVIGVEKLEETEMMPEYNEKIETRLYIALLSQFSYICFFTPYCIQMGLWAFGINVLVMYLMLQSYGYFFKKTPSRRMRNIKIWTGLFKSVAVLGIIYNSYILYKTRKDIFESKPEFIAKMDDGEFIIFLLILEHLIFAVVFIWNKSISEIPCWLALKFKYEKL